MNFMPVRNINMTFKRLLITWALHERHWVFGINIGYLEEIPAYGIVFNLGAGGIIIGYLVSTN